MSEELSSLLASAIIELELTRQALDLRLEPEHAEYRKASYLDVMRRLGLALEKKEAVTRNTAVLRMAIRLMRVCYDEANRLANHCKDGAARWAMDNLYRAANDAKAGLWDSVESAGLAHTDSVFRNPKPPLSEHDGQPESATGVSSPKDSSFSPECR